jgi:hypothetical protein
MKLNTINIVEVEDSTILQIFSFTDDDSGSKEALKVFKKLALKAGDKNVEVSLDDGYYKNMDYCVYIEHSV